MLISKIIYFRLLSVDYKVDCSEQQIRIRVNLDGHNFTDVYLENLKGYPGE